MPSIVRRVEASDRAGIFELFQRAFGHPANGAEWAWKYDANPHPTASTVALDDGRVVGHFGTFGTRYRGAGGDVPGASGVDVMTDPAVRSRGHRAVFKELGEASRDLNRAAGVPFYFGFPNERARIVGEKLLGYKAIEPAGQLTSARRDVGLLRRLRRRLLRVSTGPSFSAAHEALAEVLHARAGWRTDRSRRTLNWRIGKPGASYRVHELLDVRGRSRGCAVVRLMAERALLVDLQVADEDTGGLGDLLDAVWLDLAATPAAGLEVRAPRGGVLFARLREELGFAEAPTDTHLEVWGLDPGFDAEGAGRVFDYRFLDHDIF